MQFCSYFHAQCRPHGGVCSSRNGQKNRRCQHNWKFSRQPNIYDTAEFQRGARCTFSSPKRPILLLQRYGKHWRRFSTPTLQKKGYARITLPFGSFIWIRNVGEDRPRENAARFPSLSIVAALYRRYKYSVDIFTSIPGNRTHSPSGPMRIEPQDSNWQF